jgi:putative redox protein
MMMNTKLRKTMKATIQHVKDMTLVGKGSSGHWIPLDAAEKVGGSDSATRPLELLLIGLGGCTLMDVISILRKKRVPFTDAWVELEAPQAPDYPMVFTDITLTYHVQGKGIKESDVARTIELSEDKYCSANAMLSKAVPINTTFVIHDED